MRHVTRSFALLRTYSLEPTFYEAVKLGAKKDFVDIDMKKQ